MFTGVGSFFNKGTRARKAPRRRSLVGLVAMALAVGSLVVIQPLSATQAHAAVSWTPLIDIEAVWLQDWPSYSGKSGLQQEFSRDDLYLAPHDAGWLTSRGGQLNMVDRLVWDTSDADNWKVVDREPFLAFRNNRDGSTSMATSDFNTMGVGPMRNSDGTVDRTNLVAYFWHWSTDDYIPPYSQFGLSSCPSGQKHIYRVRSKDALGNVNKQVEWACMPKANKGDTTGGEVDQLTGKLYIQGGTHIEIDSGARTTTDASSTNFTISVWDPGSGSYVSSTGNGNTYSIQPGSKQERVSFKAMRACISGGGDPTTTNSPCADARSPYTTSDMALDASGNIYALAQSDDNHAVIIRITPTRDGNGNISNATCSTFGASCAWRYYVVSHITEYNSTVKFSDVLGNVGSAFYRGNIYVGGYNGSLRTAEGQDCASNRGILEIDPLNQTGRPYCTATNFMAGTAYQEAYDFASAQTAGIIQGTVYHDINGNGIIDENGDGKVTGDNGDDPGLANQRLALYRENDNGTYSLISTTNTDSRGDYYFMVYTGVEGSPVKYSVRLIQPYVNLATDSNATPVNVNAVQTWADGGRYNQLGESYADDPANGIYLNRTTARCWAGSLAGTDYTGQTPLGGTCYGNVSPYDTPDYRQNHHGSLDSAHSNLTSEANILSEVVMLTSGDVADASFGVTIANASWGDAQSPNKSTAASAGPYHVNLPNYWVKLGSQLGKAIDWRTSDNFRTGNGVNDSASNAHASDDGITLKLANATDSGLTYTYIPLQDQLLSVGRTYDFAAEVSAATGYKTPGEIRVTGWMSPPNSTTIAATPAAAQTFDFGTPAAEAQDDDVVYRAHASYDVPVTPAVTGVKEAVARFSATSAQHQAGAYPDNASGRYGPAFSSALGGSAAGNAYPWVSDGEIEDYRVYLAQAQLRVAVKTTGGTAAVNYTVDNTVSGGSSNPSRVSGSVTTTHSGVAVTSATPHAIDKVASPTVVKPSVPTGWSVTGASCYGSATGYSVPGPGTASTDRYSLDSATGAITIPANYFGSTEGPSGADHLVNDLTCEVQLSKNPDAAKASLELDKSEATVGTNIVGTVTVRDSSGNTLPGVAVQVKSTASAVKVQDAAGVNITSCTTDQVGQCKIQITSETAGTYTGAVHALVKPTPAGDWTEAGGNGDASKASPATVKFVPAAASAQYSLFEVSPAGPLTVGSEYSIKVTAFDSLGNKVPGTQVVFSDNSLVLFNGTADQSDDLCTTGENGECTMSFTAHKVGTFPVHGKIGGVDIAGAGDAAKKSPQSRQFTVGSIDPTHSTLEIAPASVPVGSAAVATVTLQDTYGNPVGSKTQADMGFNPAQGLTLGNDFAETTTGQYTVTVTATKPAVYTLASSATGDTANVEFTASTQGSAAKSVLTVTPADASQTVGQLYTLEAAIYDGVGTDNGGRGNPVNGVSVTFAASGDAGIRGFTPTSGLCSTGSNGKCSVSFTSSLPGVFEFSATIADKDTQGHPQKQISGSPVTKEFTTGPIAADNSSLEVDRYANVGEDAGVTVTLRDSFNNPVRGLTKTQLGLSAAPNGATLGAFTESSPGVYTGTITSTVATKFTVSALPTGLSNALSAEVEFSSSQADAQRSDLVVDQAGPLPVGQQAANTYKLTVTVRDAHGNLVQDAPVNFSVTPSPSPTLGPVLSAQSCDTDANGTCYVTVYSKKAGSYQLHAKIGSVDVAGNGVSTKGSPATRKWDSLNTPDAANSTLSVSPKSVNAGSNAVATIELADAYGNPITGFVKGDMALTANPTGPTFANDFADHLDGSYTVTIANLTRAGTQQINAAPLGVQLTDSLQVQAKQTNWDATWVAESGNPATGVFKKVTLTVKDEYGNPIQGLQLSDFSTPNSWGGMTRKSSSPDLTSGQAVGEYYWELAGSRAQDYSPQISIDTAQPSAIVKSTVIRVINSAVASTELVVTYPAGRSDAVVSGPSQAGSGDQGITVTVTVLDGSGAPVAGLTAGDFTFVGAAAPYGPVSWKVPSGRAIDPAKDWLIKAGSFTNNLDGTYTWKIASNRAGTYNAAVTVAGVTSSAEPAKFVAAAPKDPGGVTLVICPSNTLCTDDLAVDNGSITVFQNQAYAFLEVTDDYGNLVDLDDPAYGASGANAIINAGFNSDPTGVVRSTGATWTATHDAFGNRTGPYRTTLTGPTGQTFTVSVVVDGVTGSDKVRFKPGDLDHATLSLSTGTHTVCANASGNCITATVKAFDSADNPITGLTSADFAWHSNPDGVQVNTHDAQWAESNPGTYVAKIWSTKASNYYVSAAVRGTETNQVAVTFTPGSVCTPGIDENCPDSVTNPDNAHRTRLEIVKDGADADGSAKNRIDVYLFDAFGNAVPNYQVRSCDGGCADVTVATANIPFSDADGKTTVEYTATKGGDKSVTVEYAPSGSSNWKAVRFVAQGGSTPPASYASSPATINFKWRSLPKDPADGQATLTVSPDPATVGQNLTATLVVVDGQGDPISGLGLLQLTSAGMTNISSAPVEGPDGTYVWTAKASTAANASYTAQVEDQDGTKVTDTYAVVADVPAAAKSALSVNRNQQIAGQPILVTYTVHDAYDNPVLGLTAGSFATLGAYVSGGAAGTPNISATPGTFVSLGAGVYTWQITSAKLGSFELSGTVSGVALSQHPQVVFTAAGVCVVNCPGDGDSTHVTRAVISKNGAIADGVDTDEVTVYAFDAYGNPVSGAAVIARRDGNTALQPDPVTGSTDANGEFVVKWTSTVANTFKATITVDGLDGFDGWAPQNLNFNGGAADYRKSTLTQSPAGPIKAGESYTLTATVRDAQGNLLDDESVNFSGDASVVLDESSCNTVNGVCQVQATATVAGKYQVNGFINGTTHIQGSGADQSSPKELEWTANLPCVSPAESCSNDPAKRTRVVPGDNGATADGVAKDTATLYVFDAFGNPVSQANWAVSSTDAYLNILTASGKTGDAGTAGLEFTSGHVGTYFAKVVVAGQEVQNSPLELSFQTGAVSTITASQSPTGPVRVAGTYQLSIHAADASSHPVADVVAAFQLPTGLTAVDGAGCRTDAQGNCSIDVTSTKSGSYEVAVQTTPTAVPNKLMLQFTAGTVDAGNTRVEYVKNGALPNEVDQDVVRVIAQDTYGNPVVGAVVRSTTSDPELTIGSPISPTGEDGISQISYTASAEGTYLADITVNSVTPTGGVGSPVSLGFSENPVDAAYSSWEIDPAGPLKVGETADNTYTATVTARGSDQLPAANAIITFSIDKDGTAWGTAARTCKTNALGKCYVKVYSTKAGTYAMTASAADGPIGQSKPIAWKAEDVCDKNCTPSEDVDSQHKTRYEVTRDNQRADNAAANVITVYAFDQYGNPVAHQPVGVTSSDVALRFPASIPTTGDDGATAINVYSKVAGEHVIEQLWIGPDSDKKIPPRLPAKVHFVAGPGCAAGDPDCPDADVPDERRTRLEVVTDNQTADGSAKDQVKAYVFDKTGNPVVTQIQSTAGADVTVAPIADTSADGGVTMIEYATTKAGSYAAHVQFMREGAWEDIVFRPQSGEAAPAGSSSPVTISFAAGAPAAANSVLVASPATQTVNNNVLATITVKDANNNPVTGLSAADFTVTGVAAASGTASISALPGTFVVEGPGVYTFGLTSKKVGEFTLTGTARGVTLLQHPTVTFTAAGVCVTNCPGDGDPSHVTRAEVTKNGAIADGADTDEVTVYAFDSFGNAVAGAEVVGTADSNTALTPSPVTGSTNNFGVYVIKWTSTQAGTFKATITVAGLSGFDGWAPQALNFNGGEASTSQSTLVQSPAGYLDAGQSFKLTATVADAQGNLLSGESVQFSGPAEVSFDYASCLTVDGVCEVNATATKAGTYEVHGRITTNQGAKDILGDGTSAQRSPKQLEWRASVPCVEPVDAGCATDPAKKSRVEVTRNDATADGVDADEAVIYVFDRYGNPLQENWSVSTADAELSIANTSGVTGSNGTVSLKFTSQVMGKYHAAVTLAGKTPTGSPLELRFQRGDVASVTASKSPEGPIQVGGKYRLGIHAADSTGNPVNGVGATFELPAGLSLVTGQPSCQTDAFGNCSLEVTSTKAETFEVAVKSTPAATPAKLVVGFTAGAVNAATTRVEYVKNGALPNGVDADVVRVIANDGYGNPVPGAVVASTTQAAQLTVGQPIQPTDSDGVTQITYTANAEGIYPADITVDGVTPTGGVGSPVQLGFSENPVDASQSDWSVSPNSPINVGEGADSTYTATVTARGRDGQPAANAIITFAISPDGPVWEDGFTCKTDRQGVCSVAVHSTKSGTYSVTAGSADGPIGSAKSIAWSAEEVCDRDCTPVDGVDADHRTRYEVTVDSVTADNAAADVITVWAFDKYGNPVPHQPVGAASADSGLRIQAGNVTGDSGSATVSIYSKVAGEHSVDELWIGPESAKRFPPDLPAKVHFVPGEGCAPNDANCPDASVPNELRTRIEITANNAPAGSGEHDVLTVFVFDKFGNPVSTAVRSTAPAQVTVLGPIASTSATTGATTIEYVSDQYGDYQVAVEFQRAGAWEPVVFKAQAGSAPPANYTSSPATISFADVEPPKTPSSAHQDREDGQPVVTNKPAVDAEPGDTITVTWPDGTTSTTVVDGDGGWSVPIPEGTDGDVTVTATDPSGNTSDPVVVHVDVVDPEAPGSAHQDRDDSGNPVVTNKPAGDAGPGDTVTVTWPDGTTSTVDVDDDGGWSVPIPDGMPDGDAKVTVTDAAGNTSPEVTVPVDVTAPDKPTIDVANATEVSGTGDPGSTVTVVFPSGSKPASQETVVGDDGKWKIELPDLEDGESSVKSGEITAVATDDMGNASDPVRTWLDTEVPGTPAIDKAYNSLIEGHIDPDANDPGTVIKVTFPDGSTVEVTPDADGRWNVAIPEGADREGTVKAVAIDPAGNVSDPASKSYDGPVDPPGNPEAHQDGDRVVGCNAVPGNEIEVTFPGGASDTVTVGDDGCWSVSIPEGTDSGDTVVVQHHPESGKQSDETRITIDTEAPDKPGSARQDREDNVPVVTNKPSCDGTPGDTITVVFPGGAQETVTVNPDGCWSVVIPDGEHDGEATVTASDEQGNTSAEVKVPIDVTPPETPSSAHQDGPQVKNDCDATPGDKITVTWPDGSTTVTTVGSDGCWSVDIPADTPSGDTTTVTSTDPAGNESDPVKVPIDTTAPDAPSAAHQDRDSDGKPVVTNAPATDAEPGATVVITWPDGSTSSVDVGDSGTWSVAIPDGMPDGEAKVVVKDEHGNTSAEVVVDIDVTPPSDPTAKQVGDQVTNSPANDADPGDRIIITWPDGSSVETVVGPDGSWSVALPPVEGEGQATVVAIDAAGNVSQPTVIDVYPPLTMIAEVVVETTRNTAVEIPVLDYVTGGKNPLQLLAHTEPDNGMVQASGAAQGFGLLEEGTTAIIHTPNSGFVGEDHYTVTVGDSAGNTLDVPIHVLVLDPGNAVDSGGDLVSGWGWLMGQLAAAGLALLLLATAARSRSRRRS
ncbi:MAG: Ig-like domain-containing protein [Propionibacteriaceae bacterium]|jgi:protocatechuate 3,4-dioxygenase beta subunit|nr:Ig-like domain-containing protein [Propionibacteriaceae bacterium]